MAKKLKKKKTVSTAAQADPTVGEESDEDVFGEEDDETDELSEVEDFDTLALEDNFLVRPSFEGVPLNQVPGKLRKFLNQ